jgi:hypothetical protein
MWLCDRDSQFTSRLFVHCWRYLINYVEESLNKAGDIRHQSELLQSVFQTTTHTERRERLRAILPEITPGFFRVLGHWGDENAYNNDAGISLCKDLLDLIEFDDLREDWGEPERTIIWGYVQFMTRHDPFFLEIFNPESADQSIDYIALRKALMSAYQLTQRDTMVSLGLAILNVILEATSRAVSGPPMVSRADELRFETLVIGARLIVLQHKSSFKTDARRVLDEAQTVFKRLATKPMDRETRINLDSSAAAMLGVLGDIALDDGDPEEAVRLHVQNLGQHEALVKRAREERLAEEHVHAIAWSVPNLLWRLARAEIRLWRLKEACDHLERAIIEYKGLGRRGRELAEHLQTQAEAEFLRTNFDRAEALLDEAARLRREEESE